LYFLLSEGSNYLKTKVSGQSEDFFKNRNFFFLKVSVVKFMKFLISSNSVEIWLFCQFDYSKQESGLRFLLLVPVTFLLIFLSTAMWIFRKTTSSHIPVRKTSTKPNFGVKIIQCDQKSPTNRLLQTAFTYHFSFRN
jgi:hypothetical protein